MIWKCLNIYRLENKIKLSSFNIKNNLSYNFNCEKFLLRYWVDIETPSKQLKCNLISYCLYVNSELIFEK